MTSRQRAVSAAAKNPATTASTATVTQRERRLARGGGESTSTSASYRVGRGCLPRATFSITFNGAPVAFCGEEESALMAVKVVHVSDISGKEADEQSLGRLVVHEHPEYADLPVTLEVLPDEVESLQGASRFVSIEWIGPGARKGERLTVSLDDFNLLAGPGVMESAIQDALIAKHRNRPRSAGGPAGGGRSS